MRKMTSVWGIRPELGDQRILRPGRWLPARAIGWLVALVFAIVLAFGPAMEALSHGLPSRPALQFVAHAVGAITVLAAYATLVRLGENRTPTELSVWKAPAGVFAGLVIGAIMFSLVMAIMIVFGFYRFDYHGPAPAWHGAGLAIESAVFEEVLVRGVVLRVLWRSFGPWAAFGLSALLFGGGHFWNPGATWFTTVCIALEAGVMLGAFYALTGRLWVSIGVHAAWNFTQGYVFGAAVSGGNFGAAMATSTAQSGVPTWLTGGAFGPEASLPAVMICTGVGAGVLWFASMNGRFVKPTPECASPLQPRVPRKGPADVLAA
jgi:membrane protease YdiL (CAAX protease family)